MKKILLLIPCLISIFSLYGQNTFRNTKWGMTKEQVKVAERSKIVEENSNTCCYNVEVLDHKGMVLYLFHKSKLYQAVYVFTSGDNGRLDEGKFEKQLTEKYGAKIKDRNKSVDPEVHWSNGNTQVRVIGNEDILFIQYHDSKYIQETVLKLLFKNTDLVRGVSLLSSKNTVRQNEINSILKSSTESNNLTYTIDKEWASATYSFNNDNKLASKSVTIDLPNVTSTYFRFLTSYLSEKYGNLDVIAMGELYPIGYSVKLPDGRVLKLESDNKITYIRVTEENTNISKINSDL